MLGKLIKYDLKSIGKTMIPLWITVIILGGIFLIFGLQFRWDYSELSFAATKSSLYGMTILVLLLAAIFVAMFVVNIMFIIQRFWNGLLKEEGYLMFTLPVSVRSLILSKSISAFLISLGSMITAMIVGVLVLFGVSAYDEIAKLGVEVVSLWKESVIPEVLLVIATQIWGLFMGIYRMYAAMAIGHLSNKNRLLCSFLAYLGISIIVEGSVIWLVESFWGILPNVPEVIYSAVMGILALAGLVAYHGVTEIILTKRLNLE